MPVTYNSVLVIASALIAVAASYIALELASQLFTSSSTDRRIWLISGGIAMGTGIWAMHFIAMLAFSIPIQVTYDPLIVLVSLLLAIGAAFQALLIVSHPQPDTIALLGGSSLMGVGIALMHYSGMAAMMMPATLQYRPGLFAASVVIAILVSLAALKFSLLFRQGRYAKNTGFKLATAGLMGGAVLAMHYTGMASAIFTPEPSKFVDGSGLETTGLASLVCLLTVLLLGIMIFVLYSESESLQ